MKEGHRKIAEKGLIEMKLMRSNELRKSGENNEANEAEDKLEIVRQK